MFKIILIAMSFFFFSCDNLMKSKPVIDAELVSSWVMLGSDMTDSFVDISFSPDGESTIINPPEKIVVQDNKIVTSSLTYAYAFLFDNYVLQLYTAQTGNSFYMRENGSLAGVELIKSIWDQGLDGYTLSFSKEGYFSLAPPMKDGGIFNEDVIHGYFNLTNRYLRLFYYDTKTDILSGTKYNYRIKNDTLELYSDDEEKLSDNDRKLLGEYPAFRAKT
ncbi:MAG: hypothetical protein ACRC5H_08235 [Treponemataceae bacterium]